MQTITNVYGTYLKLEDSDCIKTQIMIQLLPGDLGEYWTRCGLTADFGASFMSFCYPNRTGAKNSLSFILNELVENALKFSDPNSDPITISLMDFQNQIIFEVSNFIVPEAADRFKNFIQKNLAIPNVNEVYLELLNNQDKQETSSQLGLMTIINNFKASCGFLFVKTVNSSNLKVTVQIIINPSEI